MIKDRLQEFLIHPFFISLVIWVVVVLFIPPLFSKYKIKHIGDEFKSPHVTFMYNDFDNDNNSEKIMCTLGDTAQTQILISSNDKVIDQYNLKYQPWGNLSYFSGDYNNDGYEEFYVFTMNQDSIFLNIIDPLMTGKIVVSDRFIDFRMHAGHSMDAPLVIPVGMIQGTGSINKDLIFFITTGFSKQPRNIYKYIIEADSLLKSPKSGAAIIDCNLSDINGDNQPEYLLNVDATGNLDRSFPFCDSSAWLMVLNHNLEFIFPPVEFREYPSRLRVIHFKSGSDTRLVAFIDYSGIEKINSSFYLFDTEGNKIAEKSIQDYEYSYCNIYANHDDKEATFYFLKNRNAVIEELDSTFRTISTTTIPEIESSEPIATFDADLDGKMEYMFQGRGYRSLIITQNNFKYPVEFQYEKSEGPLISQILRRYEKPVIYLQFKDFGSYLKFSSNPMFFLKYPFYASLYFVVLIFISLIYRMQQHRLYMKQQTEKRIAGLQMKAIKNQIDPHFTLNILNAIGSLYATEKDKDKADYIFGKYAKLIRQTVISSDQIIVTLADELDFVKNYIDLERFRCDNSFDYRIEVDKEVDTQVRIPRMLIYTFVENAIKYGIRSKPGSGYLKIDLKVKNNTYQIIVEDNGPGLSTDGTSSSGTGKGLVIINELIDLYNKLEKVKTTYLLQNISGSGDLVAGTRAIIELSYRNPKS